MGEKLDKLDMKIIDVLSHDPRLPFSSIAKKVRSSKEVVNYRVKRLTDKGIIKGFITSFNFGHWPYKVLLQFEKIGSEEEKALIAYLETHPNTYWVTPCSGYWDMAFAIMAKDPAHFETVLREIIKKTGKHYHDYKFAVTLSTRTFGHKYITGKTEAEKKHDRRETPPALDEKDRKIARMLLSNARVKLSDISNETGTPIDTVKYRIKRMTDNGTIKYFRMLLDTSSIGYQRYSIFMRCVNLSEKTLPKFEEFARQHANIAFYARCVGGWDIEYTAYLQNNDELRTLMLEIKKEFGDSIKKIESVNLFRTKNYSYMPEEIR
ncbi:Lrp/AsnC family transcriptional regulator [Candidatus Woesearchaeota archaeon]|nr:Lrp/AsnC family transcriptional regulator [Candidatus Woesearchaeota archaeon]